jgi:GYF domain 2
MHLARATIESKGSIKVTTSTAGSVPPPAAATGDRWYVTNGVVAVGPVGFELLIRGVEAGRIPPGSFVRHESWKVWRRLEDIEALSATKRQEAVERLAAVSAAAEERASAPYHEPPPPPTEEELDSQAENASARPPSLRPAAIDPAGVLANATNLDEALSLALSAAATAAAAHIGFLNLVRPDLGATVIAFAHGPDSEVLLGERLAPNDPALLAAQAGHTVMGEPRLGEAGRYIAGRMARCLPGPRGVAMAPVLVGGHMAAMIEVGRASRPFRASEIARVEDVAEALAARIEAMGWN